MASSDVCGEGHRRQHAREEVHEEDQEGDSKATPTQRDHVTVTTSVDALEKVVLPRVQLDHLDVADGLSRHLHASIFAFHDLLLDTTHESTDYEVRDESHHEHSSSREEAQAENVEGQTQCRDEDKRQLYDSRDLVADPEQSLGVNLDEVNDLSRREIFVCST